MCTDLPARMFWERPNGAQRRSVGHADLPSCEHDRPNPLLRATSLLIRQELKICKKAISLPSCSLPLKILVRLKFLVKYSILAPTTEGAAGLKYGFLFYHISPKILLKVSTVIFNIFVKNKYFYIHTY